MGCVFVLRACDDVTCMLRFVLLQVYSPSIPRPLVLSLLSSILLTIAVSSSISSLSVRAPRWGGYFRAVLPGLRELL